MDNTVAWALALAPLGLALLDVVLADGVAAGSFEHVSLYAAVAVNTALAIWDHSKLKKAGIGVSLGWGLFLVPVYLILRARRVPRTTAIPLVWSGSLLVSVVAGIALANYLPVDMDTELVEQDIAQEWARQTSSAAPSVSCPDSAVVKVGESFPCDVASGSESYVVDVTVESGEGTYTWNSR